MLTKRFLTNDEKVYFSRRKLKQNKEIGEFAIERIFERNGFSVYYPELLSISEQIGIVSSCSCFASVEGTLAHNIVFAKPGTKQIILRKQSEVIPRQYMLCQAMDIKASFIDCYVEPFRYIPFSHSTGPFLLIAGKSLKQLCENEEMEFIYENPLEVTAVFLKYLTKCLYLLFKRYIKHLIKR